MLQLSTAHSTEALPDSLHDTCAQSEQSSSNKCPNCLISSGWNSNRQFLGGRAITEGVYLLYRWSCSIDQSRHHLETNHRIVTETMAVTHHIVALDSWVKLPDFDFPHSLDVITDGSALTRPEQLKDATIAIDSQVPVNAALLDHMPKLQLLAATGTGVDHIDNKACRARGIVLCKTPAQNTGRWSPTRPPWTVS
jgi:hypothetical protein